MTHHFNHPAGHGTTLPIHHPKPVVHPHIPVDSGFIAGRTSAAGLPPRFISHHTHPVMLGGQIGHLGVQLRNATHAGNSESTLAHARAKAIIVEMQQELSQIGTRNILSPRVHSLQNQLDHALRTIAMHDKLMSQTQHKVQPNGTAASFGRK